MSINYRKPSSNSAEKASSDSATIAADSGAGPSWLQLGLVVLLVFALAAGAIALLYQLDPTGPWVMMPLFALVVAVESMLTRRWLDWPDRKRHSRGYMLAELVVILSLAPLFLWLASGEVPFPPSLFDLLDNPFTVFNVPLVLYMLLALLAWQRTHSWTGLFVQLALTTHEIRYYTSTPSERWDDRSIVAPHTHRAALLSSFVRGWIGGGILLVLVAALVSFDLPGVAESLGNAEGLRTVTRLGIGPDLLLALLVYFLGGLWLISQGRFAVLKGRWLADGSQRDLDVVARWRSWALLLVVVLSLLALFLPIGTTYPLFQVMQALISFLSTIVGAIFALVVFLVYSLLSLLPSSDAPRPPPVDFSQLAQPDALPADTTLNVPPLLAGSLFWLALLAVVVASTIYFMRERGPDISLAQLLALWRTIQEWLAAKGRAAAATASLLAPAVRWRLRRVTKDGAGRSPFRIFRVGSLPPREQVRFLYLSLVRHAGKQGYSRHASATPLEFRENLKAVWPDASADLDLLTGAFIAARYSAQDIDRQRLKTTKAAWRRLRSLRPEPVSQETSSSPGHAQDPAPG